MLFCTTLSEDLLVAAHGAGMAWLWAMRPSGAVIELRLPDSRSPIFPKEGVASENSAGAEVHQCGCTARGLGLESGEARRSGTRTAVRFLVDWLGWPGTKRSTGHLSASSRTRSKPPARSKLRLVCITSAPALMTLQEQWNRP